MNQEIEDRWGVSGKAGHEDRGVRVVDVLMVGELFAEEFFIEFGAEDMLGFADDFR